MRRSAHLSRNRRAMSLSPTSSKSEPQLTDVQRLVADEMDAVDQLIEQRLHSEVVRKGK